MQQHYDGTVEVRLASAARVEVAQMQYPAPPVPEPAPLPYGLENALKALLVLIVRPPKPSLDFSTEEFALERVPWDLRCHVPHVQRRATWDDILRACYVSSVTRNLLLGPRLSGVPWKCRGWAPGQRTLPLVTPS